MSINVECPSCRATAQVPEQLSGKKLRCNTCREEFRVGGRRPAYDDEDDGPRRSPRRRSSSPLVPLLIVGGVLGVLLVGGIVVALVLGRATGPRQPFAMPGVGVPQGDSFLTHTIFPPKAPGAFGRSDKPAEGAVLVTLSNFRRGANGNDNRPRYLVDYQWKGQAPKFQDSYMLYVKVADKMGDTNVHFEEEQMTGTLAFAFFPGSDPGRGFDIWIGKRALTGGKWSNTRHSNVVTLP